MDQNPLGEARFYQGVLIRSESYHGDYVCPYGGIAMSGSDGMDSSTQVPVVRYASVPVAMNNHARQSMPLSPEERPQ
jgi:hypothetical protein